jgi:hypothetical protein
MIAAVFIKVMKAIYNHILGGYDMDTDVMYLFESQEPSRPPATTASLPEPKERRPSPRKRRPRKRRRQEEAVRAQGEGIALRTSRRLKKIWTEEALSDTGA